MICSDSLSSLQAIANFKLSNPLVLEIITKCHILASRGKSITFCWVPSHVDIRGNELADEAAKSALDKQVSACSIPYADHRPHIRQYIWEGWQQFWDEQVDNKLHNIKPRLGPWAPYYEISRRDQLVITRCHIGHTYLTQGYLLRKEDPPMCVPCMERLSVEHILVHCPDLADARNQYYECQSVHDLFEKYHFSKVLHFLREAGLYRYI